jgi:sugar lactone lactonase YvrE
MTDVVCVLDSKAALGECPVWSPEEQVLYWVDTLRRTLNRFDPTSGTNDSWEMPADIGCCALRNGGGLVVGLRGGFHLFDPRTMALAPLHAVDADRPEIRLNDGRCDRAGRFWAGTVRSPPEADNACAALYRLDRNRVCERMVDGLMISNGLAFSPDDRTLYLSDSHPSVQTIWAFDFDLETGTIANRRVFATTHDLPGRPDGATVDSDGFYWSANVDGGQLVRFAPSGRVDRTIPMPVSKPSMCNFGGPDLNVLFVTSIRPDQAFGRKEPLAGGIFALDPGVKGLPEPKFLG